MTDVLLHGIGQLVTPRRGGAHRGSAMRDLLVLRDAAVEMCDGRITWVGERVRWRGKTREQVDLGGRAVVPGLVDPHTHAVWCGDRLADFEARSRGATYEDILAAGGGIWHTIRETAGASCEDLVNGALSRLQALQRGGATVVEVKSGYGFAPEAEIRMLEAVGRLQERTPLRLTATLLIHVAPRDAGERARYREMVCRELVPEVARRGLATAVDIFVEKHAWGAEEAREMLLCARGHGLGIKLHTEQFHRVGGLELGMELAALSVDHLEVCTPEQVSAVAQSPCVATVLPGVTLHLGGPAAPARALVDAGAAVAVGTDLNPGSSPLFSPSMALALSVRLNGLTPAEALVASTVNAAAALGMTDVGCVQPGMCADLLVLAGQDWRELAYTMGKEVVAEQWIAGKRVMA